MQVGAASILDERSVMGGRCSEVAGSAKLLRGLEALVAGDHLAGAACDARLLPAEGAKARGDLRGPMHRSDAGWMGSRRACWSGRARPAARRDAASELQAEAAGGEPLGVRGLERGLGLVAVEQAAGVVALGAAMTDPRRLSANCRWPRLGERPHFPGRVRGAADPHENRERSPRLLNQRKGDCLSQSCATRIRHAR